MTNYFEMNNLVEIYFTKKNFENQDFFMIKNHNF